MMMQKLPDHITVDESKGAAECATCGVGGQVRVYSCR